MKVAYKEFFKMFILTVLGLVGIVAFVYAFLWVQKTVTYAHLYKALVEETITEMVKPEYLK